MEPINFVFGGNLPCDPKRKPLDFETRGAEALTLCLTMPDETNIALWIMAM